MRRPASLKAEELRWKCDTGMFIFGTTDDLPALQEVIGQERALKSIEFGLGIQNHNYNIYVLGESGTGKATTVRDIVTLKAKGEGVPPDWCYIYDFSAPGSPMALSLPPGRGSELAVDMEDMVGALRRDIPKVFESKDYERHRDEIIEGQQEREREIFLKLEQQAADKGLMLKKGVSGLSLVPAHNGKPMSQEEYGALPKERRGVIQEDLKVLQDKMSDAIRDTHAIEKETKDRIDALDKEVVQYVVNPLINDLLDKFGEFPSVVEYIEMVKENLIENIDDFRPREEPHGPMAGILKMQRQEPSFERFKVNVFVNNADQAGAPVVYESNPTYYNLFGRVEYTVQYGVASTDFTMIKAGSLHRANGGYLIVNAMDILRNIFVYDSLKRMLKDGEIKIEDVWEQYKLVPSSALKPAPIPVKLKIILIGEPFIYYLLYNLDTEYRTLFKVKADFDTVMPRSAENIHKYSFFVAARCKEDNLKPFDRSGVAAVAELGCRLAGDREKLSARFNDVKNLIVEASHWAGVDGSATVTSAHVDTAERERVYRASKIEDKLRDYITEGTIMVATDGAVVGQVNGIAVLDPGDYAFGKPSRITASTFMGDDGVVNIEREVKLSGKIHNKAVMIISGFLGRRFAQKFPLTLSASVTFEQLYDEVEGDSATCSEMYALLSAISGIPLDQGIAVTGSMNQMGEAQPIGGVNEKIEGFFDVCKARGLTNRQGVIIPKRNVRNLMLRKDVVAAVEEGAFAIYPIETMDEGIEILTGLSVDARGPDGNFPPESFNDIVEKKLLSLSKGFKEFGRPDPGKKSDDAKKA